MGYLTAENINKTFGNNKILENVSIHLDEGEIVSLLGVSGGGKSTLFNILSGLDTPDNEDGKVILNGKDITGKPGEISYMLQKDLLQPHYTVLDNIILPLTIKKRMKKKDARKEAESYFEFFGLAGTQKKYPHQLSGGMKQRAALLRTYLASEGVALLDEPFSALDTITKTAVHSWYLGIMKEIKLSTLFVTHDIEEAILLSDRIYILSGKPGKISDELAIKLPEPKESRNTLSPDFLSYKRQIIEEIASI